MNETSSTPVTRRVRGHVLRLLFLVTALVLVFGWLLPQFIDYAEVWDALAQLDGREVLVLLALGLARVPTEALMYRAFLPGLSVWRGTQAYLSANLAGLVLPPPSAEVVKFGYFRSAGYEPDAAGLAALGSFLFPTIGRFLLPLVALVLLVVTSEVDGSMVVLAGISLAITVVLGTAGYVFLRTERSARWLGRRTERPLSWILVRLKRDPIDEGAERAAQLRARTLGVLRVGWSLGSMGVTINLFITYLILLAALRFVGVSASELSAVDAFAAFAIAFWAGAVFPLTGSGLGVVDTVLIAALVEVGSAPDDTLVAAALLWRVFYSLVTLPLGAITLSRFRKTNPDGSLSGTAETTIRPLG